MNHLANDISPTYMCENCNKSSIAPKHCGRTMKIKTNHEITNWVCWKGEHEPCCGRESLIPIEICCEKPKLGIAT